MKGVLVGLVILFSLLLLLSYNFSGFEQYEKDADLKICWGPEPESFDPAVVTGLIESRYLYAMFEGLVTSDPSDPLKKIPGIAERWDVSADRKTYTFHLRRSFWSNGDEFISDDILYSWRRILSCEVDSNYASMLYYIKNARDYHQARLAKIILEYFSTKNKNEKLDSISTLKKGARQDHLEKLRTLFEYESDKGIKDRLTQIIQLASMRAPLNFSDVGIKAPDKRTLIVELESPVPFILDVFSFMTLLPVNRACIQKYKDDWVKPENIIVNGPFILKKWIPHYMILLERNENYYGAKNVKAKKVACFVIDSPTTALNYYEQGKIDWLDRAAIPADFVESLMKRSDFELYPVFHNTFLRFNTTKAPLDNKELRKTIAMAIDKQKIVDVLKNGSIPSDYLVPPFPQYEALQTYGIRYNPKAAKNLLPQGKLPELTFLAVNNAKTRDVFNVIRQQLKENLGIDLVAELQEWKIYLNSLSTLDYDIAYSGWIADYTDPYTFIEMWTTGNGNNRTGWTNEEYDRLVQDSLLVVDQNKRFRLMSSCEKMLLEDYTVIAPLYTNVDYLMHKDYVRGIVPNLLQTYLLKDIYTLR